jgi:hypothetical protein
LAFLLARCCRVSSGSAKLAEPAILKKLLCTCNSLDQNSGAHTIKRHIVTVIAISLKVGNKSDLQKVVLDHRGIDLLIAVLPKTELGYRKTSGNIVTAGNAFSALIACAQDANGPLAKKMADLGVIPILIEAVKSLDDGTARKNAATLIAKLAQNPQYRKIITDLHGMEVLMRLGNRLLS